MNDNWHGLYQRSAPKAVLPWIFFGCRFSLLRRLTPVRARRVRHARRNDVKDVWAREMAEQLEELQEINTQSREEARARMPPSPQNRVSAFFFAPTNARHRVNTWQRALVAAAAVEFGVVGVAFWTPTPA